MHSGLHIPSLHVYLTFSKKWQNAQQAILYSMFLLKYATDDNIVNYFK